MASEKGGGDTTLEFTPTWVVAAVCSLIIFISLAAERCLHYLGKFLKHKKQDALFAALEKLKEELMLLGFISLLLTVFQSLISQICIPKSVSSHMLPCKKEEPMVVGHYAELLNRPIWNRRSLMSGGDASNICTRQRNRGAKIRQWKHWEDAIHREQHSEQDNLLTSHLSNNHPHHHPHHQFLTERAKGYWRKSAIISWIMSFLKQFHSSVTKSDYKALRAGFIVAHCRTNPYFDFHKYMMRALEDDFKKVVGISWYLWLFVIIFMLLNVHGWHTYFWLSFLPLILLLIVGTKLEHIITRLAQEIANSSANVAGVTPSNLHFWFHRPAIVLYLIHFILFQNAFEIAFFFWILSTYGIGSCVMESMVYLIPRLVMGLVIQLICSYSTLPLYAIVTQMGDSYKQVIFANHMQANIHGWFQGVRNRKRKTPHAGFSSVFRMFGHKNKKPSMSGEMQMFEDPGSSHHMGHPEFLEEGAVSP